MKIFTLDGKRMLTIADFYTEIQKKLCPTFTKMGHNLNALNDIFRGGFGQFDLNEHIGIEFVSYKTARKALGVGMFKSIIRIMRSHDHVKLLTEIPSKFL